MSKGSTVVAQIMKATKIRQLTTIIDIKFTSVAQDEMGGPCSTNGGEAERL
jgi:hypothetical protein